MKNGIKYIIDILLLMAFTHMHAQTGFFVPSQGNVFFKGDSAGIFSNVINNGKLGVGKKAYVDFKGRQWQNDPLSTITNENDDVTGSAGVIGFTDTLPQIIIGGYNSVTRTGPMFGNIQINNKTGVFLTDGSAKIRNELNFHRGSVYLNDNILVVGDGSPGIISGFDSSKFIVTGNSSGSGILLRENIRTKDKLVVFPIGSHRFDYTPAAVVVSAGAGDDYYASVFDGVRANVVSGDPMTTQSVNKTWQVGKRSNRQSSVQILLQHRNDNEGLAFKENRERAYVSAFVNGQWDKSTTPSAPVPGFLNMHGIDFSSGVNGRWFKLTEGADHYYTKFSSDTGTAKTKVFLSGYRKDPKLVEVYWFTKPEVNNDYFIVQRRFGSDEAFINIDTVYTKAPDGNSTDYLRYSLNDLNNYNGLSYYRLIVRSRDGASFFSETVVVGAKAGGNELLMWPNPSTGRFRVGITGYAAIKYVVVWDIIGQKVLQEPVNDRSIIELQLNRPPGTYLVGFVSFSGQIVETKKLIIVPY